MYWGYGQGHTSAASMQPWKMGESVRLKFVANSWLANTSQLQQFEFYEGMGMREKNGE